MAKIFYTTEEACAKLGKTNDQLLELIKSGKLREFRDGDQLMLKVEDVNSIASDVDVDSELKISSGMVNLDGGSDSFELDLTDSSSPVIAVNQKDSSPVGLSGPDSIEDDLALELDSMSSAESPAPASKSAAGADEFSLELEMDAPGASASPAASAAKSASASGINFDNDSLAMELDLSDPAPTAPIVNKSEPESPTKKNPEASAAADSGAMMLEDSMGLEIKAMPQKAPAKPAANTFDQTMEDSRSGSSIGFDSKLDSKLDSAAGGSAGIDNDKINLDQPESGSGLLDLTQESEDSQMGAALMDEAFADDEEEAPKNASGIFGGATGESGINEAAVVSTGSIAVTQNFASAGSAAVGVEIYSGSWSGLAVGLLVPAIIGLTATAAMLVVKTLGGTPDLAIMFASDWMTWTGGYAGAIAICGGIGFFVGKATE